MPVNLFEAIEPSVSALLGGARVDLMRQSAKHQPVITDSTLVLPISIDEHDFQFVAERPGLIFTKSEQQFMRELLTAFAGLYTGFKLEGYAAHFRTALLASIMDITVARYLRGDRSKAFWPIQQLIQLLKSLSYQRYEGKPATTGFLVHRTTEPVLKKTIKDRTHTFSPLQQHEEISPTFFNNPLTYRFVDGDNLFFVSNVQMQVVGLMRTSEALVTTDIERLTQREIFSLVRRLGHGAFAITVNEVSEIEVLISPAKLLVRRKGVWAIFDPDIFRNFLSGSISDDAIDDLLWTVYAVSKLRHGTVILIHGGTNKHLATLKKGSVGGTDPIGRLLISQVKGVTINNLKKSGMLLRILSSDGIAVLDTNGKLVEAGFIIDTSPTGHQFPGVGGINNESCFNQFTVRIQHRNTVR